MYSDVINNVVDKDTLKEIQSYCGCNQILRTNKKFIEYVETHTTSFNVVDLTSTHYFIYLNNNGYEKLKYLPAKYDIADNGKYYITQVNNVKLNNKIIYDGNTLQYIISIMLNFNEYFDIKITHLPVIKSLFTKVNKKHMAYKRFAFNNINSLNLSDTDVNFTKHLDTTYKQIKASYTHVPINDLIVWD